MTSTFVLIVIRGEIERRLYNTKVMSKAKVAREGSDEQLVAVVQIQSGKSYLQVIKYMKPNIDLQIFFLAAGYETKYIFTHLSCSYSWLVG